MGGVGKTSLVCKLTGQEVPKSHKETPGIQMSMLYWPAKIQRTRKVVMFKLLFWDAGEQCLNKFNHILPACRKDADAVIFTFSFANKITWDELPALIARSEIKESILKIAVGTSADKRENVEELRERMRHFEEEWQIPVLKIANVDGPLLPDGRSFDGRAGVKQVMPFLNRLVSLLWSHDQSATAVYRPLQEHNDRVITPQERRGDQEPLNQARRLDREVPLKSKRLEREAPLPAKRQERDFASSSSSSSPERQQKKSVISGRMAVEEGFDDKSSYASSTSSGRKSAIDNLTITYC